MSAGLTLIISAVFLPESGNSRTVREPGPRRALTVASLAEAVPYQYLLTDGAGGGPGQVASSPPVPIVLLRKPATPFWRRGVLVNFIWFCQRTS